MKIKQLSVVALCASSVAVGVVGIAPAGATSLNTVMEVNELIVTDLEAMGEAGQDTDYDGMETACSDLAMDADLALTYSRPKSVAKAAWRHMRQGWSLQVQSGDLCEEAMVEMDADKLGEATDLLDEATAHIEAAADLL